MQIGIQDSHFCYDIKYHPIFSGWLRFKLIPLHILYQPICVADPRLLISDPDTDASWWVIPDPDPTLQVASDPDPDPCPKYFREMLVFKLGMHKKN